MREPRLLEVSPLGIPHDDSFCDASAISAYVGSQHFKQAPPSFESRAFAHVKHRRRISLNNGSSICKSDGPAGRRVSLVPSSARTSCAKRF